MIYPRWGSLEYRQIYSHKTPYPITTFINKELPVLEMRILIVTKPFKFNETQSRNYFVNCGWENNTVNKSVESTLLQRYGTWMPTRRSHHENCCTALPLSPLFLFSIPPPPPFSSTLTTCSKRSADQGF